MRCTWAMLMASWAANAQPMPLEELVCSLAIPMLETSGLAPYTNDVWITHNDGGGETELYFFSQTDGHIVGNLKLNGAENVDWEELAFDQNGHLYVGDFGNNLNRRKELVIYKLKPEQIHPNGTETPEIIRFGFADQTSFPPKLSGWHYDVEAMVILHDSIHLFTKNRGKPFNGYTYRYVIPAQAGQWQAKKVDSLFLGTEGIREEFWVSSAYYDGTSQTLALLTYQRLFLLSPWNGQTLALVPKQTYRMGVLRQREALAFKDGKWWLTEEGNGYQRGHFYTLNLSPDTLYLLESEVEDELVLKGFVTAPCRLAYEVFDQLGRRLMYGLDTDTVHGRLLRKWDVSESLPKGSFVLYVRCGQQKQAFRFSKTRRRQSKATENPAEEGKK